MKRLYALSILAINHTTGIVRHQANAVWAIPASEDTMRQRFTLTALAMPEFSTRDGWTRHDVRWLDITETAREVTR